MRADADETGPGGQPPPPPLVPPLWSLCRLTVPVGATGVVLLAQTEGRDAYAGDVAGMLNDHRLATLRLRLLDPAGGPHETQPDESSSDGLHGEPPAASPGVHHAGQAGERARALQAGRERLQPRAAGWAQAIASAHRNTELAGLPIGLFADGLDAAAALHLLVRGASRAGCGARLAALVCGGAWLELLPGRIGDSEVATLLLVGADDRRTLAANRQGLQRLGCKKRLEVVPGAGPLFDQHGALAVVSELAAGWFTTHLGAARWT